MKELKQLVTPRPSVFEKSRRDVVHDITQLTDGRIDADEFFTENYITQGMKHLYQGVMRRLEGKSDDGVFKLTQAMGGGKTHNMIAVGLLAQHPKLRDKVMGEVYKTSFTEPVKVIGFSGRERPDFGVWGFIAEKLGKKEFFKDYYDPLDAPGQSAWINLLKGEKLIILLDELPPYFQAARARQIGGGTLADLTVQALANLLVATGKSELKNVAIIVSDLSATYQQGSEFIRHVEEDFENEIGRVATNFTPVQQTGDEIYNILRKRLFLDNEVSQTEIDEIASAYKHAIEDARRMDLTNESPDKFAAAVRDSFPFHPGIKDLFARFKENPGFQQTRGLIRLMRTLVSRIYDKKYGWADKISLIAPHDIDLNDSDTLAELNSINETLTNAIQKDIADEGDATSEKLDAQFSNTLFTNTSKLLLISSLSTVQGAPKGLKDTEIVRNLASPGIDVSRVKSEVIPELRTSCWYLHLDNAGNFLFKDVANVVAKLNEYIKGYNQESIRLEVKKRLDQLFQPQLKDCYQRVYSLPSPDEIEHDKNNVSLIIYAPYHSGGLHPDLIKFYDDTQYKNRYLFLTGDTRTLDVLFENAKGLRAAEAIIDEFKKEKMASGDPQMVEAERLYESFQHKFNSAVRETFVKLYYPTKNGLMDANFQMQYSGNKYDGEEQIKKTLEEKKKFTSETTNENFVRYVEGKLFTQQSLPWRDILDNAATKSDWLWHRLDALNHLKMQQVSKDLWRESGEWVDKGPFPPPQTSISIREVGRNDDTGEVTLKLSPIHGDTIHYEIGDSKVTTASVVHDHTKVFQTTDLKVSFLCVDSTNRHQTGEPAFYKNKITLKHRFYENGNGKMIEMKASPDAEILYTTDGSDPLNSGGKYNDAISIPQGTSLVLAAARKNGIQSEIYSFKVPADTGKKAEVDKSKPATLKIKTKLQITSELFEWLKIIKKLNAKATNGITLSIDAQGNWLALETGPTLQYDSTMIEQTAEFLRNNLLKSGDLRLDVNALYFETGQAMLDYLEECKLELKEGDFEQ
jgi:hypothetical protein